MLILEPNIAITQKVFKLLLNYLKEGIIYKAGNKLWSI